MRVNDQILRYMTIRVDEMRRRADKLKDRRARKAAKKTAGGKANKVEAQIEPEEEEPAA
jgi:hypothetical protein